MSGNDSISIVMPTYNRAEALRSTLPDLFEVEGVAEIIVVNDGSSDDTARVLAAADDPRLRVIRHESRRGAPAARNTGVGAATGSWVLFGEDDCCLPPDYALTLRSEAELHGGAIVAAPWLNVPSKDERLATVRSRRANGVERIGLDTHPSTFPTRTLETPFLPALALIRRDVFDDVSFCTGFRGNAYREETDFFVTAAREGFRCLLTPSTASFQAAQWPGGQRTGRLRYEYWVWRNNRMFLARHGDWLRAQGYIRSRSRSEIEFVSRRIGMRARGRVRALLGAEQ